VNWDWSKYQDSQRQPFLKDLRADCERVILAELAGCLFYERCQVEADKLDPVIFVAEERQRELAHRVAAAREAWEKTVKALEKNEVAQAKAGRYSGSVEAQQKLQALTDEHVHLEMAPTDAKAVLDDLERQLGSDSARVADLQKLQEALTSMPRPDAVNLRRIISDLC
jgi:hypothetical protein